MKSNILAQIPVEVLEDVVCKFLDVTTLFSLTKVNKWMKEFVLSSSIVWKNTLFFMIKSQENDEFSDKELIIVMSKLFDEFSEQIMEFKKSGTINGILHYLNEKEFKTLYEKNYENPYFFLYCLFKAFSFDKSGFPKRIILSSREEESHYSLVDFTNNGHCFHVCHEFLNGDWETCRARKSLVKEFRYYWAFHLTTYHPRTANSWIILLGVENLENQPRNEESNGTHYYLGSKHGHGKGYCVATHSRYYISSCEYSFSKVNQQGDIIGVEYCQNDRQIIMKFYCQFGNLITQYEYDLKEDEDITDLRPAVSVVSRMKTSLLPWDGSIETLQKLKPHKPNKF